MLPARTIAELDADYTTLARESGDMRFRMVMLNAEIQMRDKALTELDKKMFALSEEKKTILEKMKPRAPELA